MGVTEELEKARDLLAAGDVRSLLRHLHSAGDTLPLDEVARLVEGAARLAEFDDLAQAAAAVADGRGPLRRRGRAAALRLRLRVH